MSTAADHRDWPLRAALLAVVGGAVALALHYLLQSARPGVPTMDPGRLALAAFLVTGAIAFAFVVERGGQALSAGFALAAALVVAGVIYWNGAPQGWAGDDGWRLACALLTVAVATPLFQAWRGARGAGGGIPYVAAHNGAWTDVVLWFAAWLFVGIVWLLALLLAQLFDLIGLHFLRRLLDRDVVDQVLTGFAFGGAVGLLRDRERVLGTLQRVVTTVLSVLAPVLAAGLLVFLAALPFTGLAPLWEATKSTTPILLACIAGALVLANAVIGDAPEDETPRRALRWAAIGLGVAMLPLAVIAAVSTGTRIGQYGLTPDRLWAVICTGVACAYGLAYWVALARARLGWAAPVRVANLRLGIGLCGLALLLSTPLLGFGAIATRDQLARLADGRTPPDRFDFVALRFDFGPTGKAAVERLATAGATPAIRTGAASVLKTDRWSARQARDVQRIAVTLDRRLTILPKPVPLPAALRQAVAAEGECADPSRCTLLYTLGAREAFLLRADDTDWSARLVLGPEGWTAATAYRPTIEDTTRIRRRQAAVAAGQVEVRKVERRQLFIGGDPVGDPFE